MLSSSYLAPPRHSLTYSLDKSFGPEKPLEAPNSTSVSSGDPQSWDVLFDELRAVGKKVQEIAYWMQDAIQSLLGRSMSFSDKIPRILIMGLIKMDKR